MPHEIADSDESDLDSPHRPSASPIPENSAAVPPNSTSDQDPFANIAFDQFLSPTQRLSSAAERQDIPSSNERFLQDIAGAQQPSFNTASNLPTPDATNDSSFNSIQRKKSKRSLSDIEAGAVKSKEDGHVNEKSKKRAKTYGSSRLQKSDAHSIFTDTSRTLPSAELTSRTIQSPPVASPANAFSKSDSIHQTSYFPGRQEPLYGGAVDPRASVTFLNNSIHNTSVMRSSVGGYQGINMDFRGAGISMDMAANPFGSLSQISLDDDDDNPSETAKLASLFQHSQTSEDDAKKIDVVQSRHLKEMATSPLERTESPTYADLNGDSKRSIHKRKADSAQLKVQQSDTAPEIVGTIELESSQTHKKKRGRKSESSRNGNAVTATHAFQKLQELDPLDLPQENYKPRPSRSRASTVDPGRDYTSHDSENEGSKRREKQKSIDSKEQEALINAHASSELNLSDPAMIGAPEEMYVPRASKSRSKRVLDDEDEDELQMDDLNTDTREVKPPPSNGSAEIDKSSDPISDKKKPGKKNKTKRAKISKAIMHDSAQIDHNEEANISTGIDQLSSTVAVDPSPAIETTKTEEKDQYDGMNVEDDNEEIAARKGRKSSPLAKRITIDVPPVQTTTEEKEEDPEVSRPRPEPKKRGRKPKKKQVEVQIQAGIESDVESRNSKHMLATKQAFLPEEADGSRPILLEKHQNTVVAPTPTPSGVPDDHAEVAGDQNDKKSAGVASIIPLNDIPPIQQSLKSSHTSTKSSPASPAPPTSTTKSNSSLSWIKPRIGLSRRLQIPSLLRKLDRTRSPPRIAERKEKLSKRQLEEQEKRKLEAEDAGEQYVDKWDMRGKDGMLMEWDE